MFFFESNLNLIESVFSVVFQLVSLNLDLVCPDLLLCFYIFYSLIFFNQDKKSPAMDFYLLLECLAIVFLMLVCLLYVEYDLVQTSFFDHMYLVNSYILFSKAFITFLTIAVLWISKDRLIISGTFLSNTFAEFSIVIMFAVLFIFILLSSADLFSMYLAVEGLSATLYVLCAMLHQSIVSSESAVKYFSLGAIASGLLLYGITSIYGLIGDISFFQIQLYLLDSIFVSANSIMIQIGFSFILVGFLFKIAAFPGHVWVIDVYDGVWKPVAAFFSIVIKVSLILFLLRFIFDIMFSARYLIQPILAFSGIGSMFIGVAGTLQQQKIIRFIAYASINQVGYLLLGMASGSLLGLTSTLLFIIVYSVMSLIFFRIILNIGKNSNNVSITYLTQLINFSWQDSKSGVCLAIVMLSMGGLPPLGGFVSKYLVYEAVYQAHLDYLLAISLLISVVTASYYLDFVKLIWLRNAKLCCNFFYRKDMLFTSVLTAFLVFFIFFFSVLWEEITLLSLICMGV